MGLVWVLLDVPVLIVMNVRIGLPLALPVAPTGRRPRSVPALLHSDILQILLVPFLLFAERLVPLNFFGDRLLEVPLHARPLPLNGHLVVAALSHKVP